MGRNTIRAVIWLGTISLITVFFVQFIWVQKTVQNQKESLRIQRNQDSLNTLRFSEKANEAFKRVLDNLNSISEYPVDNYGAVKQVRDNYFAIDIADEVEPLYLETLLKREFYASSLNRDFYVGVYNCYTDSIEFGYFMKYKKDSSYIADVGNKNFRRAHKYVGLHDGHYFTVTFPYFEGDFTTRTKALASPWWYMLIVVSLIVLFFGYAISVLLKQKRLSEIKNDFINNMTHELKTPISTIGLSSEMLRNPKVYDDKERLQKYAEIIYKENKRLENQVERVLNIAKLDKEKINFDFENLSIHELLQNAKESFDFNQVEKGGSFEIFSEAKNDLIPVDEVHITNVIYNLIDNAVKYCPDIPFITVTTASDHKSFSMIFTDNGIGIKREDQRMIFDKFYRVSTGNRHDVKGFGLGLYYVKLIVQAHQGTISLKSQLGKGSSFKIVLPLVQNNA